MKQEYAGVEVQFAPFLLDATVPPEGRPQAPPSGSGERSEARAYLEGRAEAAGVHFTQGRTHRSSSLLAHQAAEFAADHEGGALAATFHRAVFEAYFEEMADIGEVETLARLAAGVGLPADRLREALTDGVYRERVDEAVAGARLAGVRSVPTFIFDEEYAIVGAQEYRAFEAVMHELGREPRPGSEGGSDE